MLALLLGLMAQAPRAPGDGSAWRAKFENTDATWAKESIARYDAATPADRARMDALANGPGALTAQQTRDKMEVAQASFCAKWPDRC